MQISITFDPDKDKQQVYKFLDGLYGPRVEYKAIDHVQIVIPEPDAEPTPVDIHVNTPEQAEEVVTVDEELVRANIQAAIQAGKRQAVLGLLEEFGAANFPALSKDKYPQFNEKLVKL